MNNPLLRSCEGMTKYTHCSRKIAYFAMIIFYVVVVLYSTQIVYSVTTNLILAYLSIAASNEGKSISKKIYRIDGL